MFTRMRSASLRLQGSQAAEGRRQNAALLHHGPLLEIEQLIFVGLEGKDGEGRQEDQQQIPGQEPDRDLRNEA